ncbi:MAG: S8 family serine peptidase, partial [Armatimonadetes bacterium]|nr:S8 family serine peptidase [Armatimonadota bacterium]
YAWNKGAVLVCAAGNSGTTAATYPAFYTNCLAVAASDPNDARPSWSTYGSWVEVAAPGLGILSTMQDTFEWCSLCWLYGYFEGYDTLSGTSMATSVVSGLAALVWASGKCGTNACVRSRIENNTDPVPGGYVSKGRVNFFKALNAP